MSLPTLKPGMIGINLKGDFDPLGTVDTFLEGDTKAAHVWWVLPNGKIATTGASWLVLYGEVDPAKYLRGKTFFLLETVDPLTPDQLSIMQVAHEEMLHSGWGRLYGGWKIPLLLGLELLHGSPEKMGKDPKTTRPTCPICDQAVGYPFWKADVPIGKEQGKQDWSALSPKIFLAEASQTSDLIKQGWLVRTPGKPCYYLTTVQDKPFIGAD